MPEETVDLKFIHHHTDRTDREKPVDYLPGQRAAFPVSVARSLVKSSIAEYATKKAEAAAEAPTRS